MTDIWLCTLILLELNIFLKSLLKKSKIAYKICRIHSNNSVMYGFYCITFMISGETLDYPNLFSPIDFIGNDKIIICKYFQLSRQIWQKKT